jgi:hypothetical protein
MQEGKRNLLGEYGRQLLRVLGGFVETFSESDLPQTRTGTLPGHGQPAPTGSASNQKQHQYSYFFLKAKTRKPKTQIVNIVLRVSQL